MQVISNAVHLLPRVLKQKHSGNKKLMLLDVHAQLKAVKMVVPCASAESSLELCASLEAFSLKFICRYLHLH
ncbi:unnamed protein product [Cylicocyclus nassatus]|uniref:Uncharacterized protein n=1 Tax=Cylicocyclus nassatus TaxID=53992 RepID=A0AA36GNQ8_CYLNA|nr:unnamed protein product [Cylicocyclus nassatus]